MCKEVGFRMLVVALLLCAAGVAHAAFTDAVFVSVTIADPDPFRDSDGDGIWDQWEFDHFGNLAVADRTSDYDGDGVPDSQECAAGTDPKDEDSALQIAEIVVLPSGSLRLTWASTTNDFPERRYYDVYEAATLGILTTGGSPVEVDVPSAGVTTAIEFPRGAGDLKYFRVNLHQ